VRSGRPRPRRSRAACLLCSAALLVACSDPPPETDPIQPQPQPEAPAPEPAELRCAVRPLRSTVHTEERPSHIVVHELGEGAVAWTVGETLVVGNFDAASMSARTDRRDIGPDHRLSLVARTERGTIVVTEKPCVRDAETRPCIHGHLFPPTGDGPTEATTLTLPGPVTSRRRARTAAGVYLAHAHRDTHIQVNTFEPSGDGSLRGSTHRLGTEVSPTLSPVEVLGMAAHLDRWAVFWRFGAEEASSSEVVLSLPSGEHPAPLLRHALSLDTVLWRGGSIRVVAGFEFARPALFRVATNGRLRWLPRAIAHRGALPSPNEHRYNARLHPTAEGAMLEVSSAAGDPLTRVGPLGSRETLRRGLIDVSRAPGGFVVATMRPSTGGWSLAVDRVLCPDDGEIEPPLEAAPPTP